jgi:hypothetical protein
MFQWGSDAQPHTTVAKKKPDKKQAKMKATPKPEEPPKPAPATTASSKP